MTQKLATFFISTPEIDNAERLLLEQLRALDREYKARAQPILDKLAQFASMKTPSVIISEQP